MSMDVARRIKETLCYTASDVVKVCCSHAQLSTPHLIMALSC